MIDPELSQKIVTLEQKIDAIYVSAEKTRKYFMWTLIVSLVAFVLPLIGLMFAIPSFLGTLANYGNL